MRLNRFIAHNSNLSRREADVAIFDGKIKINGKVATNPAIDVDSEMRVSLNEKPVKKREEYSVIVYNKPKGELVTKSDPKDRKTIYHSLGGKYRGFSPVGRLDFSSEGVLILSDNIEIVERLMASSLERVYKIKLNGLITKDLMTAMQNGLEIRGSSAGGHEATKVENMDIQAFEWFEILKSGNNYSSIKVSIKEGKNRELRRFFAQFNLDVLDLKRVSYGFVNLNALPTGKKRFFTKEEYTELRTFMKENSPKDSDFNKRRNFVPKNRDDEVDEEDISERELLSRLREIKKGSSPKRDERSSEKRENFSKDKNQFKSDKRGSKIGEKPLRKDDFKSAKNSFSSSNNRKKENEKEAFKDFKHKKRFNGSRKP
jgi:23S rRNA pseudouridine2605 synthase